MIDEDNMPSRMGPFWGLAGILDRCLDGRYQKLWFCLLGMDLTQQQSRQTDR
jgi:hypothetical protein